jgi:hypothetical protein
MKMTTTTVATEIGNLVDKGIRSQQVQTGRLLAMLSCDTKYACRGTQHIRLVPISANQIWDSRSSVTKMSAPMNSCIGLPTKI